MTQRIDLGLDYEAPPGFYDEMLEAPGAPRPHWRALAQALAELGRDELARRWEGALRLIHDHGVTYNVYGDPQGLARPWQLDPFPLVIAAGEWARLRTAIAQRARLLDAILVDLYGAQRLLRADLLPPELVFAHPYYLRPCHGLELPGSHWIQLYAADLARTAQGEWAALADRTQAPSGMGYALENRVVLSRALPEAFRENHVEPLGGFTERLRDTLRCRSPRRLDDPRIGLLTPGPWNETYFEHAYLARVLGLTLVEGADLTVRDRALYLKTLGGLERIDVLLRRVDDVFCDPLSLRSDSSLGIAGLVQAVRSGSAAVVNALGSGLVESPALLAFLPDLCRTLLGEDLLLPSVPTWWCGRPESLSHALANLHTLVIKPTFPGSGSEPIFGAQLCAAERESLADALRARPGAFVAQQIALSTAPVWDGERAQARTVGLRAFALGDLDGQWEVMPGGLARVSHQRDSLVISMQRGGGSKDVWICGTELPARTAPPQPAALPHASAPLELKRAGAELPSRVADDLFWLARYVERVEGTARIARTITAVLSGERSGAGGELAALWEALAQHAQLGAPHAAQSAQLERALLDFLFRNREPGSLQATLRSLHQLAFSLRDRISLDSWRVLSGLQREVDASQASGGLEAAGAALNRLIVQLCAWGGLVMESMTRTLGWRFAEMGRRMERASYTARLLSTCLVPAGHAEVPLLEALLETAESAITYRRRYRAELQIEPVLDLLLTDETNPRSVAFQLRSLHEHVAALPAAGIGARLRPEERIALGALARVRLADVGQLARVDAGKRLQLADLLARTSADLPALSDALTQSYLSHAGEARRIERF